MPNARTAETLTAQIRVAELAHILAKMGGPRHTGLGDGPSGNCLATSKRQADINGLGPEMMEEPHGHSGDHNPPHASPQGSRGKAGQGS